MSIVEMTLGARVCADGTRELGRIEATKNELLAAFGNPGMYFAFDDENELALAGVNWAIEFVATRTVATVYGPDVEDGDECTSWKVGGFSEDAMALVQETLAHGR